jgi:3-hydroxyisobutyrate dehydrogenase/2-hydroxy-3-oxopropionate reductase
MMQVGYVGLGSMGLPMALNLRRVGFALQVVSRSRPPIEQALAAGATEAASYAALAGAMDVVCTCLPMPADVEHVYLAADGLVAAARPGTLLIDHSTVGPDTCRKIAAAARARGVRFLDAPVSGGPAGAQAGTLGIMVGGERAVFEQARPVLDAMGKTVVYMGATGSGAVAKLINNLLVGVHQRALIEMLLVGQKAGVDLDALHQVLMGSSGRSAILEMMYPRLKARDLAPKFRTELLHKDLRLALEMAADCGVRSATGEVAFAAVDAAMAAGYADRDTLAMLLPLEQAAGVQLFGADRE